MAFGETVSTTDAIRDIIGSYPLSVGIFREFLQNSEDAKATKQVFILDSRRHPHKSIYHPHLASMQGPALLAYNDAPFKEEDWKAIRTIHRSSKTSDTSKIGKYGIGFRACYHITDGPQILSGSTLAMLDPLCDFSDHGGEQVNLVQDTHYTDHLATFSLGDPSLPHVQIGQPFPGSIIRLPLRTNPSAIRSKGVTPEDIKQLLSDFVTEEIHISMLFLKNVQTIEVYEINEFGRCQCLARSTSSTQPPSHADAGISTFKCSMNTIVQGQQITSDWRILEASFSPLFESRLANKFDPDTQVILQRNKLQPHMSMAIPLSIITGENYIDTGRLFTFLPLPLHTRFPVHIHGLFALTRSRDKLRNREEIGLLPGSEDSILVEWNQFLFSQCLPVVWLLLLKTLKEEGITNIFRAWPPSQMPGQLGDSGYWEKLPLDIVRSLGSSMSAIPGDVWPVIASQADTAIDYQDLQNLFVAVHNESGVILEALATLGLKITRPPSYISRLLHDHPEIGAKILTPKITREYLLKPTSISKLYSNPGIESIPTVLEYLLSDGTLDNIIDLPLILQNDGRRVALKSVLSSPMTHTMLEEEEFNRFHKLDPEAIVLHQLKPHSLAKLLKQHGPTSFNVQKLTSETVAKYIHTFLQNSPHSVSTVANSDSLVISWISDFWIWSASWIHREALRIKIQAEGLALLPTSNGLKPLYCPAFDRVGMHPKMVQCLRALGVSFLHIDFPEKSRKAVQTFRNFDNINDLQTFLDILLSSHIGAFDIDMVLFLLKHLSFCVSVHISSCHSQSCILKSHLEDEKRRRLCRLPIFPLAQLKSTISASISSIPDGDKIAGISTDLLPVLPIIPGTTFLDASAIDFSLLKFLDPSAHAHRTSDLDVLSLTVDHFEIQNQAAQFALVDFMAQRRSTLPPKLLKTLGSARFVAVANEMVERPSSLVDPSSFIAPLFVGTKFLPRKSNRQEEKLVKNLVSLDVMQSTLTINLVNERIRHISSCPSDVTSHEMSKKLLEIMDEHRFDCSLMVNTPELRLAWLPTRSGLLLNSTRCRHEPDYSRTELFDHVLLPLDSNVRIPKSLRCIFGWDSPIAISVLIDQLSLILRNKDEGRAHRTTRKIFKEILGRDVGEAQSLLQTAISTKRMAPKWVPTSDGLLVDPTWAVFSDEDPDLGFHKISFSGSNAERLFLHLGCAQSPSPNIILSRLKALSRETPTHATAMKALRLLRLLPDMATFENSSQVLVPDTQYKLGLLSDIDYNDLGNKVCLIDPNPTVRIACRDLDESLATKLGMNRLGIKFASLKIPSRDLGERPLVTIRNKLREYTERQFLPEFFANAADAKATVFGVLIDECIAPSKEILHAKMARFQTCSSLIIYNNATFTEDDFAGICDTGFGGKQGRTDSIGQFGLGALTMFHFTDLSMIISGSKIAFLDPSKRNLPLPERTLVLSLDLINKFYPEQLSVLNGLFGFDSSKANYEGTIFRLPLRERLHSVEDHVVDKFWTPHEIWEQIIRPFESSAHEFLLFTKVQSILIQRRYSDCTRNEKSFHAVRKDDIEFHDDMYSYRSEIVSIGPRRSWRIVSATLMESNYPDFFNTLTPNYRLRSPIVLGIAARLQKLHKDNKVFCTIPLPFASTLPVHITAPFILSSDRRQIRLDLLDNKGSKYNRWLLEDVLPHLYVVLLSEMLHQDEADASYYQWPGNIEQNDGLTPGLVSTFYEKHLGNTSRAIFRSHYTQRSLLPTEAIILQPELPDGVIKLFSISKPDRVILLPPKVCERVVAGGAVRVVDPAFLKTEILRCVDVVQHMTLSEQKQLLAFVARDNIKEVIGLPLLSLSDGSYATFEDIAGCTKVYYLWKPSSSNTRNLFRPDRLVDSISLPRKFLNVELNIVELKGSDIKGLLLDVLQEADERNDLCQADEELIATFWAEYPGFKSDATLIDAISSFPLVPTMQPGRYVSLSRCHDPCAVILSDRREPDSLWNELTELGLSVVATHDYDFPAPLVQILSKKSGNFPGFTFQGLLSALNSKDSSFLQLFASLSMISRQSFAQWARSKIYPSAVRDVIGLAKKLPIWPSILADSTSPFLDATNIIMLPPDVTRDMVLCFSRSIAAVEYDRTLEHLDVDSITFPELFRRLQLDRIGHLISVDNLPIYYRLLSMRLNVDKGIVPIPNSNRVLCNSDTLFARDPLFLAAFGLGSGNFVTDAIVDLETKLARFGLKREATLTRDDLQTCALAIQNSEILESIEDKKTRAATVFNAFCNMLASNHGIWNESMTSIRFVPRNDIRRTTMEHLPMIPSFAKELPPIVALSEICLPQFEALLWTQRGLLSQPSAIFSADGRFGHPTTPEVVRHLRVLALQVSKTYPGSPSVLSDIRETYKWLNEQADAAGPLLMQHNTDRLFLNVTEQDGDEWVWYSAQDLLLGIQNQWSNYQPIKSFLAPFETLLAKSGINRISPARWSAPAYTEDNSSSILSQFDGMRKHEKLTDVVFLAKDENQQVQKLAAHRTLLATRSDYFKDIFTGDFVESKLASAEHPIQVKMDDFSSDCVLAVLDYIYTDIIRVDIEPDEVSNKTCEYLLQMLELSDYWQMTRLHQAVQSMLCSQITLDNVRDIQARAEPVKGDHIVDVCGHYITENWNIIRIHEQRAGRDHESATPPIV